MTQKILGVSFSGEMLNLVNTINNMIDQLSIFAVEVKKVEEVANKATDLSEGVDSIAVDG